DQVGLVWSARSLRVLEREDRGGDDVAGPRPGPQQRCVRSRGDRETVPKDDERAGATGAHGISQQRDERAGPDGSGRQADRAAAVDQSENAQRYTERGSSPASGERSTTGAGTRSRGGARGRDGPCPA